MLVMLLIMMLPLPRYKKNIVKAQEEANVYAARAACKAAAANQHQPGPQSTSLFLFWGFVDLQWSFQFDF